MVKWVKVIIVGLCVLLLGVSLVGAQDSIKVVYVDTDQVTHLIKDGQNVVLPGTVLDVSSDGELMVYVSEGKLSVAAVEENPTPIFAWDITDVIPGYDASFFLEASITQESLVLSYAQSSTFHAVVSLNLQDSDPLERLFTVQNECWDFQEFKGLVLMQCMSNEAKGRDLAIGHSSMFVLLEGFRDVFQKDDRLGAFWWADSRNFCWVRNISVECTSDSGLTQFNLADGAIPLAGFGNQYVAIEAGTAIIRTLGIDDLVVLQSSYFNRAQMASPDYLALLDTSNHLYYWKVGSKQEQLVATDVASVIYIGP